MAKNRIVANTIRKLAFARYNLFPFQPLMVAEHTYKRAASLLGIKQGFRMIDLAITYRCNLKCKHCSAANLNKGKRTLTLADYEKIVESAEKDLDILSWNITGGEPLLSDILNDLILVLKPQKHYITVQTNTTLLTKKRAEKLAKLGVNCINTSLDSVNPEEHNSFRGMNDAYKKTLKGIRYAKKAGMQVLVGGTVTHQNLRSDDLKRLIELSNREGAIFLFNIAVPCGRWVDNKSIILRGDDRKYLEKLMIEYPLTTTDHEVGRNAIGCPAGMEKIYITAYGDVIPCPFIHVSFGNVKKESLAEIVKRMQKVSYFSEYQNVCLAGEDQEFYTNVMKKIYNGRKGFPASCKEIFGKKICGSTT